MRLGSLLADFRDRDHQLTIYRSGDPSEIELWLTDRGVSIDARSLPPGGPKPFIEIETGGKFVGIIGEEQLVGLLDPPIDRPGERDGIDEGYRVLFEVLDDTVFRGLNRRELLAVSREIEERAFYEGRAPSEWLEALAPLGTDAHKPFLEIAPFLIVIFAQSYSLDEVGEKVKHYYVQESVGIATGMLITALHHAGLVTLTHTPSPMGFLNELLERPKWERPFLILVAGYPAADATVPDISKKPLEAIATFL